MYCVNCGSEQNVEDKFCASCGVSKSLNPSEIVKGLSKKEVLTSSKDRAEVLRNSRSVREEYESRIDQGLDYSRALKNRWALKAPKIKFEEALEQKAIVKFTGHHQAVEGNVRDIVFAENGVLFIESKPSRLNSLTSLALVGNDLQYLEVDRLVSSSSVGNYKRSDIFWRLHFITKWADLDTKAFKSNKLSEADTKAYRAELPHFSIFESEFNSKQGEFTFYLAAGETEHHQRKIEEVILEKLDTLAAFHKVFLLERTVTWNRNIGLMFGAGFWNELGD
jgi:hypothetical protein